MCKYEYSFFINAKPSLYKIDSNDYTLFVSYSQAFTMLTRSQSSSQTTSQKSCCKHNTELLIKSARRMAQIISECPERDRYNTRSFTKNNITFDVDIDFDDASREWNHNKRRNERMYEYICGQTCLSGRPCKRKPVNGGLHCSVHNK